MPVRTCRAWCPALVLGLAALSVVQLNHAGHAWAFSRGSGDYQLRSSGPCSTMGEKWSLQRNVPVAVDEWSHDPSSGTVVVKQLTPDDAQLPWNGGFERLLGVDSTSGELKWTSAPADGVLLLENGNYGRISGAAASGRVAMALRGDGPNEGKLALLDVATGKQLGDPVAPPQSTCNGNYPEVNCTLVVFPTENPQFVVAGVFSSGALALLGYEVTYTGSGTESSNSSAAFTHKWTKSQPSFNLPTVLSGPSASERLYVVTLFGTLYIYDIRSGVELNQVELFGATSPVGQVSQSTLSPDGRWLAAVPNTWNIDPSGPQLLLFPAENYTVSEPTLWTFPSAAVGQKVGGGYVAWQPNAGVNGDTVLRLVSSLAVTQASIMSGNETRPADVSSLDLPTDGKSYEHIVGMASDASTGVLVAWGVDALWQLSGYNESHDLSLFRADVDGATANGIPIDSGVVDAEAKVFVFSSSTPGANGCTLYGMTLSSCPGPSPSQKFPAWGIALIIAALVIVGGGITYAVRRSNRTDRSQAGYAEIQ